MSNAGGVGAGNCKIGNWCVCQWAFARYIEMAGGCDSIVNIVCDATNMAAYKAYKDQSSDPVIDAALQCLESRCNLHPTQSLYDSDMIVPTQTSSSMIAFESGIIVSVLVVLAVAIAFVVRRQRSSSNSSGLELVVPRSEEM